MPQKKIPCPTCDGTMSPKATQCRRCKPSYERTTEHNARMSATSKGKPKPALKGRKRPEHSRKMREFWDDEERRRQAKERGDKFASDPAWRKMIAESVKGEKNPRWKGGISGQPYAPGFSRYLKRKIRNRDNRTCQLCGVTEAELGYALSIHHVDYDKSNHDEDNLASTCKACNSRVNTNREVWVGYFSALADARRKLGQNVGDFIGRQIFSQREGLVISAATPDELANMRTLFASAGIT